MTAEAAVRPLRDLGWAVGIVLMLAIFWTAVEPAPDADGQGVRMLEARVVLLLDRYEHPDGVVVALPQLMIADWEGPGIATASCADWRIRVRPGAVASLSDAALDDLLAHELAHLLACAEQGHRVAHETDWWRVYRQLVT